MILRYSRLSYLHLSLFLFSLFIFWSSDTRAATQVSGFVASSTVWTLAQSPYVIEGSGGANFLIVDQGAVLTIEPGVIVKHASNGQFIVRGALDAQGSATNPIIFTSLTDDSVGGDTNGDGAHAVPGPGNWWHIVFEPGSIGNLSYATVRYAGGTAPFCPPSCSGAGIYNKGGAVTITNSLISRNKSYGIRQEDGSLILLDSEVGHHEGVAFASDSGIVISAGEAELRRNSLHNNARWGVAAFGGSLHLHDNSFFDNALGAAEIHAPVDFIHSGNTAAGAGRRGFAMGGLLTGERAWNRDLPYIIASQSTVIVENGATLTVDPGVVVKSEGIAGIIVRGALNARGTIQDPITFTSLADDAAGGDTNADGSTSTPGPGTWLDIKFEQGSTGRFSHAQIRYAGAALSFCGPTCSGAGLVNRGGDIVLDHVSLSKNKSYGLHQDQGTLAVTDSEIFGNGDYGAAINGGSATIFQSSIHDNGRSGVFGGSGSLTLQNNTLTDNPLGAVQLHASMNLTQSGNTASGAGKRGIITSGVLGANRTWMSGLPYIIPSLGSLIVDAGSTLTLDPGVIIKSEHMAGVVVQGILDARGAQDNKVFFTSIHDDTVGGDTNVDGANFGHAGDWLHLQFVSGSKGMLNNAVVRFAGSAISFCGSSCSFSGIFNQGGDVDINLSTVSHNLSYGFRHQAGTTQIHQSAIYENGGYGIWNETTNSIAAQNNWWGHASGPFHFPTNISGEGNRVTDYVDFEPWLGQDPTITPPTGLTTLTYAGEDGFENDAGNPGIDPNFGTGNSTPFYFKIVYTNSNNNPPAQMTVMVGGTAKTITRDSYAPPELRDGNYANGEQYVFTNQFPAGEYQYHFEAAVGSDVVRLPEQDEFEFKSGLFVTPKGSVNVRSGRGLGHSIVGTAGGTAIIELFPLCADVPAGGTCNESSDIYEKIDDHYWLHASTSGIIGYVADDIVMSIVPKNQPDRIKRLMEETFSASDFDPLRIMPVELLLAMAAHESGETLNNEVTTPDSPFSGIMQVYPIQAGKNRNCVLEGCELSSDKVYWTKTILHFFDLFFISTNSNSGRIHNGKNYIETLYDNSDKGVIDNISDGIEIILDKHSVPCREAEVSWPDSETGVILNFSTDDLRIACDVWFYNSATTSVAVNYLGAISTTLNDLSDVFPGTSYGNDDQLIEKLRTANDHRKEIRVFSPVELRIYDSQGNMTGIINGNPLSNIPNAGYDSETEAAVIFFPTDEYRYQIVGTATGIYGLAIDSFNGTASTSFRANDIPIAPGVIHEYAIDEDALTRGDLGVTLKIDQNGDGIFEAEIRTGATFTDETPPEAIISFDPAAKDLLIKGVDAISPVVSVTGGDTDYVLADQSGNALEISLNKFKEKKKKLTASIGNLLYNGISTGQPLKNTLYYDWVEENNGSLKHLTQKIIIKKEERVRAEYDAKKNETKIFVKDKENGIKFKETLPGLIILKLTTSQGEFDISY